MRYYLEIIEQGVGLIETPLMARSEVASRDDAVALYPSLLGEFSGVPWKAFFHTHNHEFNAMDNSPCVLEVIASG